MMYSSCLVLLFGTPGSVSAKASSARKGTKRTFRFLFSLRRTSTVRHRCHDATNEITHIEGGQFHWYSVLDAVRIKFAY